MESFKWWKCGQVQRLRLRDRPFYCSILPEDSSCGKTREVIPWQAFRLNLFRRVRLSQRRAGVPEGFLEVWRERRSDRGRQRRFDRQGNTGVSCTILRLGLPQSTQQLSARTAVPLRYVARVGDFLISTCRHGIERAHPQQPH